MLIKMYLNDIEFEKCGDIILSPKSKIFALTCSLCNDVFLNLNHFKGHIYAEHDVYLGLNSMSEESEGEEAAETWTKGASSESLENKKESQVESVTKIHKTVKFQLPQSDAKEVNASDHVEDQFENTTDNVDAAEHVNLPQKLLLPQSVAQDINAADSVEEQLENTQDNVEATEHGNLPQQPCQALSSPTLDMELTPEQDDIPRTDNSANIISVLELPKIEEATKWLAEKNIGCVRVDNNDEKMFLSKDDIDSTSAMEVDEDNCFEPQITSNDNDVLKRSHQIVKNVQEINKNDVIMLPEQLEVKDQENCKSTTDEITENIDASTVMQTTHEKPIKPISGFLETGTQILIETEMSEPYQVAEEESIQEVAEKTTCDKITDNNCDKSEINSTKGGKEVTEMPTRTDQKENTIQLATKQESSDIDNKENVAEECVQSNSTEDFEQLNLSSNSIDKSFMGTKNLIEENESENYEPILTDVDESKAVNEYESTAESEEEKDESMPLLKTDEEENVTENENENETISFEQIKNDKSLIDEEKLDADEKIVEENEVAKDSVNVSKVEILDDEPVKQMTTEKSLVDKENMTNEEDIVDASLPAGNLDIAKASELIESDDEEIVDGNQIEKITNDVAVEQIEAVEFNDEENMPISLNAADNGVGEKINSTCFVNETLNDLKVNDKAADKATAELEVDEIVASDRNMVVENIQTNAELNINHSPESKTKPEEIEGTIDATLLNEQQQLDSSNSNNLTKQLKKDTIEIKDLRQNTEMEDFDDVNEQLETENISSEIQHAEEGKPLNEIINNANEFDHNSRSENLPKKPNEAEKLAENANEGSEVGVLEDPKDQTKDAVFIEKSCSSYENSQRQKKPSRISKLFEELDLDLDEDEDTLKVFENIMLRDEESEEEKDNSKEHGKDSEEDYNIKIKDKEREEENSEIQEKCDTENQKIEIKSARENETVNIEELESFDEACKETDRSMKLIFEADETSVSLNHSIDDSPKDIEMATEAEEIVTNHAEDQEVKENITSALKTRKRINNELATFESPKRKKNDEILEKTIDSVPERLPLSPKNTSLQLKLPKSVTVTKVSTPKKILFTASQEKINENEVQIKKPVRKTNTAQRTTSPKPLKQHLQPSVRIKRIKVENFMAASSTSKSTPKPTIKRRISMSRATPSKPKSEIIPEKTANLKNEVLTTGETDAETDDILNDILELQCNKTPTIKRRISISKASTSKQQAEVNQKESGTSNKKEISKVEETDDILKEILESVTEEQEMTTEEASKALFGDATNVEEDALDLNRPLNEAFDKDSVFERIGLGIINDGEYQQAMAEKFAGLLYEFFGNEVKDNKNIELMENSLKKLTRQTNELIKADGLRPLKVWELKCLINFLCDFLQNLRLIVENVSPEMESFYHLYLFMFRNKRYYCEHCSFVFTTEPKYKSHIETHANPACGMTCPFCLKTLKRANNFDAHVEKCKQQSLKK